MRNIICLLIVLIPFSNCIATHILSGDIGYECLGNDDYRITIELQKDCTSPGANLDDNINVAIYRNGFLLDDFNVHRGPIVEVIAEDYENCNASNFEFCREKTSYVFEVNLPKIDESYTITHQRCCWSNVIDNIVDPGSIGITVTSDITPLAQLVCNTQELGISYLSFLACPNSDVNIDVPPVDAEGDSLEYEICLPYSGGGLEGSDGTSDGMSCMGIYPNPACPPPYEELEYVAGFDNNNPFPTVDGFKISDSMLQFRPSIVGYYISGLCISEYRNGELLSKKQIPLAVITNILQISSTQNLDLPEWRIKSLTTAILTLQSPTGTPSTSFSLMDISGRNVSVNQNFDGSTFRVNIGHLSSGVYIIKIQEGNDSQLIRFFKP